MEKILVVKYGYESEAKSVEKENKKNSHKSIISKVAALPECEIANILVMLVTMNSIDEALNFRGLVSTNLLMEKNEDELGIIEDVFEPVIEAINQSVRSQLLLEFLEKAVRNELSTAEENVKSIVLECKVMARSIDTFIDTLDGVVNVDIANIKAEFEKNLESLF